MESSPQMPQRVRQHQLESESRIAFEHALPSRFVYRTIDEDYGIDGEVEEFAEDGQATGVRYFVQLKATDEPDPRRALRRRLKLTTAAYLRAQPLPVLMVRYLADSDTLYARWFHEFDPYDEHVGETHLTFNWGEENAWQEDTPERLVQAARHATEAKAAALSLPISVSIVVPENGVFGFGPTEVELAFREAANRIPEVLEVADDDSGLLRLTVGPDHLIASLGGQASVTFHIDDEVGRARGINDLAEDLLTCGALTLARLGHADVAARITMRFFTNSLVAGIPPVATELAVAMAYAGRVGDALDISERLDRSEEDAAQATSLAFALAVLHRPGALQENEAERLEQALRGRLERRLDSGERELAAASAKNLADFYSNDHQPAQAAKTLMQALELDPSYQDDAEFWRHHGGAAFLSGDPETAATSYERCLALAEEADPQVEALRADALLFAGRYEQARDAFADIRTDDLGLSAWAYVKYRAVRWIIGATGISEQERQPDEANEAARRLIEDSLSLDQQDDIAAEIWGLDAASGLGWFNRARDLLDREGHEDAMHAYLVSAVTQEGDVESWVNVALLAGTVGDDDLLTTSILTGGRLNSERYIAEYARQLRIHIDDPAEREEILGGIKALLAKLKEQTITEIPTITEPDASQHAGD